MDDDSYDEYTVDAAVHLNPERSSALYTHVTVEIQSDEGLEHVEMDCDVDTNNERLDDA